MQGMRIEQSQGSNILQADRQKTSAFSLAEMLVVLLIMSFIAIGVPLIHFKKVEMKTKRSVHGRYECFYNEAGQLSQYVVNESGGKTLETGIPGCTFTPPKNAIYFIIHAVGGGGGASSLTPPAITLNFYPTTITKNYQKDETALFPVWLKDVQASHPDVHRLFGDREVKTSVRGRKISVGYGDAGQPGKTSSLFFPRLNNVTIKMRIGKGGDFGLKGGDTKVSFVTANGAEFEVITAEGGLSGSGNHTANLLLDGDGSFCKVKEMPSRQFRPANFVGRIEMDEGSEMVSQMESSLAGSGGAGAFSIPIKIINPEAPFGRAEYKVNGEDVTKYVIEPTCDQPRKCDNGKDPILGICAAEPGKNGAVVILW